MEGILNNLSLATYNWRGFKSSMPDVKKLLNDYQIIFLQETWLAKQQIDNLSCVCHILHLGGQTMTLMMAKFMVEVMVELPYNGLKILKLHLFQIVTTR